VRGLTFFAILLILSTLGASAQCFVDCAVPQCPHHPRSPQACEHSFVAGETRSVQPVWQGVGLIAVPTAEQTLTAFEPVAAELHDPFFASRGSCPLVLRI
jgi:hypothetical protein